MDVSTVLDRTDAPSDAPTEEFDARELPPPEPLTGTVERLAALDPGAVLLQHNDRVPRHLFPRLEDRGFQYEAVESDGVVTTAIWRPD